MKYSRLSLSLVLAFHGALAYAEDASDVENITVAASRVERNIDEIASTITVIDSEQIDKQTVTDIKDLIRYEPRVVVEGNGHFCLSGFNIRGINGDRILMLLDGAPLADEFSFGPALSARRDFVDVDLIDRVEIIRGPASTLYGSDAIGGVVSFITKDPSQLVEEGKSFGGKVKAGYSSAADEYVVNGQIAGVKDKISWLLNATHREGSETETFFDDDAVGTDRRSANPQDNTTDAVQFKLNFQPNEHHEIAFLADYLESESDTNVLSQATTSVGTTRINESLGFDERERSRLQANYYYTGKTAIFDKALVRAYWQESETSQATFDERFGMASFFDPTFVLLDRARDSHFDQEVTGAIVQFDKSFTVANSKHYLIYGSEIQYTDSKALREGSTTIQETGESVAEFTVFPARDFPISDARELSFFLHDEISFFDGKLTVSPGVRYDEFKLTPRPDELFTNANPGVETVPFDDSQVSFKIGTVYNISESTNTWLQFSQGFRIPPYDDLNIGFTNLAGGYTSLSNPDLEPESVDSWEVGVRQNLDAISWSVSAYYNDYDNFIESLAAQGFDPVLGLLVFQSQNRESVNIKGIDASATWYLGESFEGLDGWSINTALTWLESEDESTGQEVESIISPQAVVGAGYINAEQGWSVELVGTFVERFDQQNDPALFEAPGYAKFDFLASAEITEDLSVNIGIFNLFDREIVNGTEVRGLPVGSDAGFFTEPGRNIAVNATYSF